MQPINFTANFIKNTQIKQCRTCDTFIDKEAAIVELDINDKNDIKSLYETASDWDSKGFTYTFEIFCDATKGYEYDDVKKEHYIALTTQKDNFENLEPDKIIGLSLFSETKKPENEINWLQVDPESNTERKYEREYKGGGRAIVNYIQETYTDKPIYVQSAKDAINFYRKCGFYPKDKNAPAQLIWNG